MLPLVYFKGKAVEDILTLLKGLLYILDRNVYHMFSVPPRVEFLVYYSINVLLITTRLCYNTC